MADEHRAAAVAEDEQRAMVRETQATLSLAWEEATRIARLRAQGLIPDLDGRRTSRRGRRRGRTACDGPRDAGDAESRAGGSDANRQAPRAGPDPRARGYEGARGRRAKARLAFGFSGCAAPGSISKARRGPRSPRSDASKTKSNAGSFAGRSTGRSRKRPI